LDADGGQICPAAEIPGDLFQVSGKYKNGRNNIGYVACVDRDGKCIIMAETRRANSGAPPGGKTRRNPPKNNRNNDFGRMFLFCMMCSLLQE
jgi:hypothetical protein